MNVLTVAVVDDHGLFREGVIELLGRDPGLTVVADGSSGVDAVEIAHSHHPDVMLMDIEMPGMGAEAALPAVLRASPATAVLILTMHDDVTYVRSFVRLGAAGYLLKTTGHRELLQAVHSVAGREEVVRVNVSRSTLDALSFPPDNPQQALSTREHEVLALVAAAHSNAEIAAELFVSQATVKRHLTNIYGKLGAGGRIDALIKARALGLVGDTEPAALQRGR